jgi:hypothetical protein
MSEKQTPQRIKKLAPAWRVVIEAGSIIFFFYSNLLMGEFTQSGQGKNKGFWWALQDIFTVTNFIIAFVLALIGYVAFSFLRKRL